MLQRFLDLFRGRSVVVKGTGKLPEGMSKKIDIGDPLAGGTQVVLCRLEGKLYAVDVRCPHEGGRMVDGPLIDGKHLRCPLHEYHFDPKTGTPVRGACRPATRYRVVEKDGDCRIWVG
jgi:nitrite reductase/ring-hydroxylating ferredoxin subunit